MFNWTQINAFKRWKFLFDKNDVSAHWRGLWLYFCFFFFFWNAENKTEMNKKKIVKIKIAKLDSIGGAQINCSFRHFTYSIIFFVSFFIFRSIEFIVIQRNRFIHFWFSFTVRLMSMIILLIKKTQKFVHCN